MLSNKQQITFKSKQNQKKKKKILRFLYTTQAQLSYLLIKYITDKSIQN